MNNPSNCIHVLMADGYSYFKPTFGSRNNYRVNNNIQPEVCPGNSSWQMVKGEIKRLYYITETQGELLHFELKEKYKEKVILPLSVPAESFEYDNDEYEWSGETAEFYTPVYGPRKVSETDREFVIIDRDCKPVKIMQGVTIDFPNGLKQYPETWHKFPCTLGYTKVFDIIHDRIEEIVKANPTQYTMTDFKNIQTLTVSEKFEVPFDSKYDESYFPTMKSRKMKKRTVTEKFRTVPILDLIGKYNNKHQSIQCESVKGNNYAELLLNLEAYIKRFTDLLDHSKRVICPHCKGHGLLGVDLLDNLK